MALRSYRELRVWQLGIDIAERCYRLTRTFPKEETFGLKGQINRASSRIPANVAEGYGRRSRQQYVYFPGIANGSVKELETHLILSGRVGLAPLDEVNAILERCDEEGRMLASEMLSLEKPDDGQR